MLKIIDLDRRICDVETGTLNTQTYRQFIEESEKQFVGLSDMRYYNIDDMTEHDLNEYFELINKLWEK